MEQLDAKKPSLAWLGYVLVLAGFAQIIYFLLTDKVALTSSIYSGYQKDFYSHVSRGELPWINFRLEYPPLAAYVLLFPAFAPGLSVLWVSILRASATLILTMVTIRFLGRCDKIPESIRQLTNISIGLMACIVPGYYFGLFDWSLVLCNVFMALLLYGISDQKKAERFVWPLVFAGTAAKLMPLMAVPFLFQVKRLREKSNFWITAGITALIHIPFVLFGFHNFRMFVSFHRNRSIDCFSTYACLLNSLEHIGKVSIVRKWNYGALEVDGSFASLFAKLSLPLFLLVLVFLGFETRKLLKQGFGEKCAFAMYLVAFLVYPAISKVSQNNYCLWSAACLICFWLIGYQRREFVQRTFAGIVVLLAIGFLQDHYFAVFSEALVPWWMIFVSALRQILSFALAWYSYKEVLRNEPLPAPRPAL